MHGPPYRVKRGDSVDDPVRTDFARILVQDRQAGVRFTGHEHRLAVEVLAATSRPAWNRAAALRSR